MLKNYQVNKNTCHTPTQRILVVDDDPHIAGLLIEYLSSEGYEVTLATNGQEMFQKIQCFSPDLVLLDRLLGEEDALQYTETLGNQPTLAVVILTSRDNLHDRLSGLQMGADDYITKPFDVREVLARIRTVLRRTTACRECMAVATSSTIVCFAGWQLDQVNYVLMAPEGVEVTLTSHEYRAMCAFVKHAPHVLSRDQLMDYLYPNQALSPFDRRIDVLVLKLRRKLREASGRPRLIKTVRGVGYVLTAQVSYRDTLTKPTANPLLAIAEKRSHR